MRQHLPTSEATIKGHIKEEKYGLESTRPKTTIVNKRQTTKPTIEPEVESEEWKLMRDMFPIKEENEKSLKEQAKISKKDEDNKTQKKTDPKKKEVKVKSKEIKKTKTSASKTKKAKKVSKK